MVVTPLTQEQRTTIDAIMCIIETGDLPTTRGYSACTVLEDGAGISYGIHQATDRSGSLDDIVRRYIDDPQADQNLVRALGAYMPRLQSNATVGLDPKRLPAWVETLMTALRAAGADPAMQRAQRAVFEYRYWEVAAEQALNMKLVHALSYLVCYDSTIQSGSKGIDNTRRLFPELPPSKGGSEQAWTVAYINARHRWLLAFDPATHPAQHASAYRTDTLATLAREGRWFLQTPLTVQLPRKTVVIS